MVNAKVDIHKAVPGSLADKDCLLSDMASPRPDKVVPLHLGIENKKPLARCTRHGYVHAHGILISGFAGKAPVIGRRSSGPRAFL
jgi:hypothetical protein